MASTAQLLSQGLQANLAAMVATGPITTIVPAGASQGTATLINSASCILGTAAAAGVILPPCVGQPEITLYNNSGNAQNVYPSVGQTINALTANTAISLASATAMQFVPGDTGWLAR